jgi:hypothetical protein
MDLSTQGDIRMCNCLLQGCLLSSCLLQVCAIFFKGRGLVSPAVSCICLLQRHVVVLLATGGVLYNCLPQRMQLSAIGVCSGLPQMPGLPEECSFLLLW